MKKTTLFTKNANAIALSLLLLAAPRMVGTADAAEPAPGTLQTIDGNSLDIVIVNSPSSLPTPPESKMAVKEAAFSSVEATGDVKIAGVPAFTWSYGASATAGAMIAGYYDRVGLANMYTGPTNGGCMPLTNNISSWGTNQCPLSATKNGLDGRTTRGHVDDYYVQEGVGGTDPYVTNGWPEHTIGECTGDYMKTSKWFPDSDQKYSEKINKDGAAIFLFSSAGDPVEASYLLAQGYAPYDAGYGLKLFFESRGYTVDAMYNQYIAPFKTEGFTYEQYKAEIDAGRPVLLHLPPHIVVGIGYNASSGNGIIFHDLWDYSAHTMVWGGTYKEFFEHNGVTIVTLANAINPETGCGVSNSGTGSDKFPWTMFLPAITNSKK